MKRLKFGCGIKWLLYVIRPPCACIKAVPYWQIRRLDSWSGGLVAGGYACMSSSYNVTGSNLPTTEEAQQAETGLVVVTTVEN